MAFMVKCNAFSKVRKTVIHCVIDAAPFWAVGAAEGGVACWETAGLAPAVRKYIG